MLFASTQDKDLGASSEGGRPDLAAEAASLPWYPRHFLLRVRRRDWGDQRWLYYVVRGRDCFDAFEAVARLDGSSAPIHDLNEGALELKIEHLVGYLKFFCLFVHGDDGPFVVVESIDEARSLAALSAAQASVLTQHQRSLLLKRDQTLKGGQLSRNGLVWRSAVHRHFPHRNPGRH